ncbi:MAG: hypothetical protein ABI612_00495 [Betaproteobacteria bacterium]
MAARPIQDPPAPGESPVPMQDPDVVPEDAPEPLPEPSPVPPDPPPRISSPGVASCDNEFLHMVRAEAGVLAFPA